VSSYVYDEWTTYAVCRECGTIKEAPFGSLFHIINEVCGGCGRNKYQCMDIKVGRKAYMKGFLWNIFSHIEIKPDKDHGKGDK
jgi:hypothetical protein